MGIRLHIVIRCPFIVRFIDTTSYTGLFCLLKLFPHIINSLWGICSSQVVHQFKWHAGTPYQFPAYGTVFSSTVRHYQRKPIMLQGHLAGSADTFYCCFSKSNFFFRREDIFYMAKTPPPFLLLSAAPFGGSYPFAAYASTVIPYDSASCRISSITCSFV